VHDASSPGHKLFRGHYPSLREDVDMLMQMRQRPVYRE
jgi:hypothetical protein